MTKFGNRGVAKPAGPVRTTTSRTVTHEGGAAWTRDAESELFLLAATNMVSEGTFYESGPDRDQRFVKLVYAVTQSNPEWIAGTSPQPDQPGVGGRLGFIRYLRDTLQMRSASVALACEYVRAGGPGGRQVVASALQRADEPAEALGYWLSTYGRKMPAPLKRGVADAAVRLYNQRSALRYDGLGKAIRFGDVLELVHPRPKDAKQSHLFKYLLDKRHHPDGLEIPEDLDILQLDQRLLKMPEAGRRVALREGLVAESGWSWERLAGWLPGGMDAEAWEHVIPQMGYMALIRNLRNFDEAGLDSRVRAGVLAKIADVEEVKKSRQFPYRFWSAYKHAPSVNWAGALEDALDAACGNVPELPGRSLILIDTSGSMNAPVSDRSQAQRYEIGALFAAVLAKRAAEPTVVIYGDQSKEFPVGRSESVLRYIDRVGAANGAVGHGTMTWQAVGRHYASHDRVVIFTDEQTMDSAGAPRRGYYGYNDYHESQHGLIKGIPVIHSFNLAGYKAAMMESTPGRYTYGGFTDATFTVMAMLEAGHEAGWPF